MPQTILACTLFVLVCKLPAWDEWAAFSMRLRIGGCSERRRHSEEKQKHRENTLSIQQKRGTERERGRERESAPGPDTSSPREASLWVRNAIPRLNTSPSQSRLIRKIIICKKWGSEQSGLFEESVSPRIREVKSPNFLKPDPELCGFPLHEFVSMILPQGQGPMFAHSILKTAELPTKRRDRGEALVCHVDVLRASIYGQFS